MRDVTKGAPAAHGAAMHGVAAHGRTAGAAPGEAAVGGAAQGAAVLAASHVRFSYGGNTVLRDVSLEVRRGSCMCLMGVNGCGKSTFLDCVLGVHRIEAGAITVEGVPINDMRPARLARKVSYVPQVHERSFPYLVDHIVLMGRSAYGRGLGAPDFADMGLVDRALADCGIAHLAKRPYTSLSGGEMQMVLLARALVQEAELIIMDEPTAHLDFKNELRFLEMIEELVKARKVTVLLATHAPNQAFHLANAGVPTQVAVMHEGVVYAVGQPGEVLTEGLLAKVFGIQAVVLEQEVPGGRGGGAPRLVQQIVPERTLRT